MSEFFSNTAITGFKRQISEFTANASKAALQNLFPNEFEYYLCTLELLNANDLQVLEYLSFPIMPDSLRISENKIQSITKTTEGIVVLENDSFIPKQISLNGNFGRRIRLVDTEMRLPESSDNINSKLVKNGFIKPNIFNNSIKSGYGAIKVLERILNNSSTSYNNKPTILVFHCYAMNISYIVQLINQNYSQSKQSNMIWEYNIQFTAVAPIDGILTQDDYKKTLSKFLKKDVLRKGANSVLSFTYGETMKASNVLLNRVGKISGLTEKADKGSKLLKTFF